MASLCKNCANEYEGNYCNNCGQQASTHKINLHYMWHDIQHGLLHVDKGILYTFKELFARPGHTTRQFIEGQRIRHFKPLSMVIVLSGIYGFLYHHYEINKVPEIDSSTPGLSVDTLEHINEFLSTHLYLLQILTLPLFALGSFLSFYKQGYNYLEHLVLNAFLAGQRLFVSIISFPIIYYCSRYHHFKIYTNCVLVLDLLLLFWAFSQFFNKLPKVKVFFLSILSYMIFWLVFLGIFALALELNNQLS